MSTMHCFLRAKQDDVVMQLRVYCMVPQPKTKLKGGGGNFWTEWTFHSHGCSSGNCPNCPWGSGIILTSRTQIWSALEIMQNTKKPDNFRLCNADKVKSTNIIYICMINIMFHETKWANKTKVKISIHTKLFYTPFSYWMAAYYKLFLLEDS